MGSILDRYDFHLPRIRIAQRPTHPRDASRLLVVDRSQPRLQHRHFRDLPGLLRPGDLLVVNDTRVFPARLIGRRETGGAMEVFLLREMRSSVWEALLGGKVRRVGLRIRLRGGLHAQVLRQNADGTWQVRFSKSGAAFWRVVEQYGQTPTPPYIKRPARAGEYQTVYARERGSVAAPTAGLHFTPRILRRLKTLSIDRVAVTLHVGYGTFQPVTDADIRRRKLHAEYADVSAATLRTIRRAKTEGRRIIAVGTTTVRVLETVGLHRSSFHGWISTFIQPPYRFRVVDAMITNFHLPRSSLLMLVSAFAGRERVLAAYRIAIRRGYRFYSFGDAMLIV